MSSSNLKDLNYTNVRFPSVIPEQVQEIILNIEKYFARKGTTFQHKEDKYVKIENMTGISFASIRTVLCRGNVKPNKVGSSSSLKSKSKFQFNIRVVPDHILKETTEPEPSPPAPQESHDHDDNDIEHFVYEPPIPQILGLTPPKSYKVQNQNDKNNLVNDSIKIEPSDQDQVQDDYLNENDDAGSESLIEDCFKESKQLSINSDVNVNKEKSRSKDRPKRNHKSEDESESLGDSTPRRRKRRNINYSEIGKNVGDGSGRMTCLECGDTLSSGRNLIRHREKFHSENSQVFKCTYENCSEGFSHKVYLNNHIREKHESKGELASCYYEGCGLKMKPGSLSRHLRTQHNVGVTLEEPSWQCDKCGKSFLKKYKFEFHERKKECENPTTFKCEHEGCDKVFQRKCTLVSHRFVHLTSEEKRKRKGYKYKKVACPTCGEVVTQSVLKRHNLLKHKSGEYRFMCNFGSCHNRKFALKESLWAHYSIHLNPKKATEYNEEFAKNISDEISEYIGRKKISEKKTYERSKIKGTNKKPMKICHLCGGSFSAHFIARHIKAIHENEKLLKCHYEGCDKAFNFPQSLKVHLKSHTKEKNEFCEICGQTFVHRKSIKSHIETVHNTIGSNFICEVENCGKAYKTKENLRFHMRKHGIYHTPRDIDMDMDMSE